jgi:hypothetical protein
MNCSEIRRKIVKKILCHFKDQTLAEQINFVYKFDPITGFSLKQEKITP